MGTGVDPAGEGHARSCMVLYGVRGYVERMNRHRAKLALLAAVPLIATLSALAATGPAAAAPAAPASHAIAFTAPGGTYSVYTNKTHITLTITSNPSNYYIRAEANCTNGTVYGGWHQSGNTSATCPSGGTLGYAYAEYSETHKYLIFVWGLGQPLSGSW